MDGFVHVNVNVLFVISLIGVCDGTVILKFLGEGYGG